MAGEEEDEQYDAQDVPAALLLGPLRGRGVRAGRRDEHPAFEADGGIGELTERSRR